MTSHVNEIWKLREVDRASLPVPSLPMALERHRNCGCKVDLDRIYAIWAFLPPAVKTKLGAPRDNVDRIELYTDVAEIELGRPNWPQGLGAAGRGRQRQDFRARAPSWVADWTYPQIHHTLWALDMDCRAKTGLPLYEATRDDPTALRPMVSHKLFKARGKILNKVVDTARPFRFATSTIGAQRARLAELQQNRQLLMQHWAEFSQLFADITKQASDLLGERKEQMEACFAVARRCCGELCANGTDITTAVRCALIGGARKRSEAAGASTMGDVLVRSSDVHVHRMFEGPSERPAWIELFQDACKGRVFFVTEGRYVGIGPGLCAPEEEEKKEYSVNAQSEVEEIGKIVDKEPEGQAAECAMQSGDRICVIRGCSMPFIIRSSGGMTVGDEGREQRCWTLIGECYVYGLMNGEAMGVSMENIHEEDIILE